MKEHIKTVRNLLLFVIICLFGVRDGISQDAHFSQFYASPLLLNPALSGTYNGTFRISTAYRDQWYSAIDNSLRTFTASGDAKFEIGSKTAKNRDIASAGISFFSDRVGTFDFNTNQILLTGAYHKSLNKRKKQYIGIGISGGIFQKTINYEDLLFNDQFNSIDAFSLSTSESLPTNNRGYFDLNTGVYYSVSPNKRTNFNIGLGIFHVNQPNLSFYNEATVIDPDIAKVDTLHRKYSAHTAMSVLVNNRTSIEPRINVLAQGKHFEINLGSQFRYKIDPKENKYFIIGAHARVVKNVSGSGLESIIAIVGYEKNNFIVGISYDQSIGKLFRDRRSLSSLELSVTYIGEFHNEDNFCPQF